MLWYLLQAIWVINVAVLIINMLIWKYILLNRCLIIISSVWDHTFMTSMKNVQFLHPPPSLIFLSVRMDPNWARLSLPLDVKLRLPTTPPPQPPPIPFGILAKNYIGKSPKYTQCKGVTYNEKQHVKSSNMLTFLIC